MSEFTLDTEHSVSMLCENVKLEGLLYVPQSSHGIVIFAHGSGSSRFSPRNQLIAKTLQKAGLATLLFDLLTIEEEKVDSQTAQFRFDIGFLASRLLAATKWVQNHPVLQKLAIGYFGASTGGGAALVAAANPSGPIQAVVSRGGRPDMAGKALKHVSAPTLLIVGGDDKTVIELNEHAFAELYCEKKLEIVPGATHLFEEPGTLEKVAELAAAWFEKYLM